MTVFKSTIVLSQSEFSNNKAIEQDGGVAKMEGVNVTISECNFTNNVATNEGGVFLLMFEANFESVLILVNFETIQQRVEEL